MLGTIHTTHTLRMKVIIVTLFKIGVVINFVANVAITT